MYTTSNYLTDDPARCGALLRRIQQSVGAARWPDARREVAAFQSALERHLLIEERINFIESVLGHAQSHTAAMRAEHARIRSEAQRLGEVVAVRNAQGFAMHAETLLLAIHLHGESDDIRLGSAFAHGAARHGGEAPARAFALEIANAGTIAA